MRKSMSMRKTQKIWGLVTPGTGMSDRGPGISLETARTKNRGGPFQIQPSTPAKITMRRAFRQNRLPTKRLWARPEAS